MKELSTEEKAQAYDKALKVANKYKDTHIMFPSIKDEMFSELKESEDEKMRAMAIKAVHAPEAQSCIKSWGINPDDVIAWLEQQGKETSWKPSKEEMDVLYALAYITYEYDEHKEEVITRLYQDLKREFFNGSSYENMFPNTEDGVRRRSTIQVLEYARSLDAYNQYGKADIDKNIAWLEKQGEHKFPIEKLPSEMKTVGESLGFTTQEDCDRYNQMVTDLIMSDDDKGEQNPAWSEEDNIEQGVLLNALKELETYGGDFSKTKKWVNSLSKRFNLQQNSAWSEEDVYHFNSILSTIECCKAQFPNTPAVVETYNADANWLKSIKDRVLPQPMQEWSEDDKNRFTNLIYLVNHSKENYATKEGFIKFINKFKFLRPQNTWKPSDEQMGILWDALCALKHDNYKHSDIVNSLYQNLKKLREE